MHYILHIISHITFLSIFNLSAPSSCTGTISFLQNAKPITIRAFNNANSAHISSQINRALPCKCWSVWANSCSTFKTTISRWTTFTRSNATNAQAYLSQTRFGFCLFETPRPLIVTNMAQQLSALKTNINHHDHTERENHMNLENFANISAGKNANLNDKFAITFKNSSGKVDHTATSTTNTTSRKQMAAEEQRIVCCVLYWRFSSENFNMSVLSVS